MCISCQADAKHWLRCGTPPCCGLVDAGVCPAFLLSAVLRGGKRQFGGKVAYCGSIRHRNPLLCCHGALARHLINRFTLQGAACPDPRNEDAWRQTPLWPGNNTATSISYAQHADSLKAYLAEADIIITKVTHAFRMYKARDLDEQGVDDAVSIRLSTRGTRTCCMHLQPGCTLMAVCMLPQVIARLGRWLHTAMTLAYLRFFKPEGLMVAAGWGANQLSAAFAERFCIDVPHTLVDTLLGGGHPGGHAAAVPGDAA